MEQKLQNWRSALPVFFFNPEAPMRAQAGMSSKFWSLSVLLATRLRNLSPSTTTGNSSPYELWFKRKPSVSKLRLFGCLAHCLVPDRYKLDSKTKITVFVGYPNEQSGYRLYDPETQKLLVSRNVTFDESRLFKDVITSPADVPISTETSPNPNTDVGRVHSLVQDNGPISDTSDVVRYDVQPRPKHIQSNFHIVVPIFKQPERILHEGNAVDLVLSDPQTIHEALSRPEQANGLKAVMTNSALIVNMVPGN
ncbi:hypothetical protein V1508DRAFT_75291 [Lipomyces doorenjongii]|uniref:uncharacterized protein n=1 Tax=Lipomyces doorenjongii TaxID=383834 RepID=UPI0034CE5BAB